MNGETVPVVIGQAVVALVIALALIEIALGTVIVVAAWLDDRRRGKGDGDD